MSGAAVAGLRRVEAHRSVVTVVPVPVAAPADLDDRAPRRRGILASISDGEAVELRVPYREPVGIAESFERNPLAVLHDEEPVVLGHYLERALLAPVRAGKIGGIFHGRRHIGLRHLRQRRA